LSLDNREAARYEALACSAGDAANGKSTSGGGVTVAYPVADLSTLGDGIGVEAQGEVDLTRLRGQLEEIRDALRPVLDEADDPGRIGLRQIEVALTVGLEGRVWFIAKGSAEASLTLTFARPEAS
jgi:hypothetical protein